MSGNEIRNGIRTCLLLMALAIASTSSLRAGDYPYHSVKVIVPFPPGGATDIAGRIIMVLRSDGRHRMAVLLSAPYMRLTAADMAISF
jgi:tripartite-type tricarboxylate transporter receptor subunit TctC